MPEGPEVEAVRRTLAPLLVGQQLGAAHLSGLSLRSSFDMQRYESLKGRTIRSLERYGKLIWLELSEHFGLAIRLGMTGRVSVSSIEEELIKHTHVRITLVGTTKELRYIDPRRFGEVCVLSKEELQKNQRAKIGPDPFSWTATERSNVIKSIRKSNRPIKNILLDQQVLCGVGNIYASEALFSARIHPELKGTELSPKRLSPLLDAVSAVMTAALDSGGTTFMSYLDGLGNKGQFKSRLQVFQRPGEACKECGKGIQLIVQSGRSTFFCANCQR